jgi:hypothetical protein
VFDALSPQRRRLVLSAAIALPLLIMAVATISVIRLIAASPDPVSQTDPGPVLLVPGYGGNVQSLEPLAEALRSTGRTAVIVDPVGDGTGDLRSGTCSVPEVSTYPDHPISADWLTRPASSTAEISEGAAGRVPITTGVATSAAAVNSTTSQRAVMAATVGRLHEAERDESAVGRIGSTTLLVAGGELRRLCDLAWRLSGDHRNPEPRRSFATPQRTSRPLVIRVTKCPSQRSGVLAHHDGFGKVLRNSRASICAPRCGRTSVVGP